MIFDIEANSLRPTKIHCLSYRSDSKSKVKSITDYEEMRKWFLSQPLLIGHNIVRYDIPAVERLLGIKIKSRIVDTLALSWYLEPNRPRHNLEGWGVELGIPKPPIQDWDGLPVEDYIHRCEEDVKINTLLWEKFQKHLLQIYGDEKSYTRLTSYLAFKMKCAALQEKSGWLLDVDKTTELRDKLSKIFEDKVEELKKIMPPVPVTAMRIKPKDLYRKDGTRSVAGARWFNLLKRHGLPENHKEPVKEVTGHAPPNPGSPVQIKNWLFSLGWEPDTFKIKRDKVTGDVRKIPQIYEEETENVCFSVRKLFEVEPGIEVLNGMTVAKHRLGITEGFLKNVDSNGYIEASVQGLTNTLRFKHAVVVNVPGVHALYGKEIRSCLIAKGGYELCGSDMSSLEDNTKRHYMYQYDPEYVKEMSDPSWDPHLDIALTAKMLTKEQIARHKSGEERQDKVRHGAKQANYACTYGAGGPRVAFTANIPLEVAEKLVQAYWRRNWSIRAIADACHVKKVKGAKWLYNPVSGLWYSLRYEKDRFSTLNQGTADYCFNKWLSYIISEREQLTAQFHDEIVLLVKKGSREACEKLLRSAIDKTNKKLMLNVTLNIDVKFGDCYAEIH